MSHLKLLKRSENTNYLLLLFADDDFSILNNISGAILILGHD